MFMFESLHSKTETAGTYTFWCNLLKHYNSHVLGGYTYKVSHSFCVSGIQASIVTTCASAVVGPYTQVIVPCLLNTEICVPTFYKG